MRGRMDAVRRVVPAMLAAGLLASTVAGPAAAGSLTTTRVSLTNGAAQIPGGIDYTEVPDISGDGRFLVFVSADDSIVDGDTNGANDVFVRDTVSGTTKRVSVASDGTQGNGGSYQPRISANGRYVVFASSASNLVSGDTNGEGDVFVHDRETHKTVRVSLTSRGRQSNGDSAQPDISDDGKRVVFTSTATNLTGRDRNGTSYDVYLRDLRARTTKRLDVSASGRQANQEASEARISGDGSTVAFISGATNLVRRTGGVLQVFVVKVATGAISLASRSAKGVAGDASSWLGGLSANGRYVAIETDATNLAPEDTNGVIDVVRKDLKTGTVVRASLSDGDAQVNAGATWPRISDTGRFMAFTSESTGFVSDADTGSSLDCFVRDLVDKTTVRVSLTAAGGNPTGGSLFWCVLSGNGAAAAFTHGATDIVPGDTNGQPDYFLRSPYR